ncbi:hypothetical protein ACINNAV113_1277 [Acinetobacter baumannii Naval-113]|nr:hypothetical protein ACINNAV113_1277 [Acinetobacter baumannii Naval-113]
MPRVDYDEQLASHREGLLDIAKRAGYQVLGLIITRVVKVHVIALNNTRFQKT